MSDLKTYEYVDYPDDLDDDALYPDDDDYREDDDDAPVDHRWRPVAVIAGGVFLAAVVATAVILNSDDRGTQATVVGPPPTRTVVATPPPTAAPPSESLSPETVTTVTPSAAPSPSPEPAEPPEPAPVPQAAAPAPPPVNPRTVVYQVTGTKQLLDLVSVVYTDGQGLPHTDVNVSLPWTKSVVLEPGVGVESVTATSLFGQLNCSIVNAAGQAIAVSANNSMIATCTR
ncbi:MmpS family transport accessory protein [Mycobacterium sp. pUA109]|uniref:MmpS family transport accessory protein n=1 Tax=Mycobacterium sp. pUA109 TaxID=3238982 RepID=UPI00351BBC86